MPARRSSPIRASGWRGQRSPRGSLVTCACTSWQDDEVSSRAYSWTNALDQARTWVLDTNGYHGMCDLSSPKITAELIAERRKSERELPHMSWFLGRKLDNEDDESPEASAEGAKDIKRGT